jgi:hypothetical protein
MKKMMILVLAALLPLLSGCGGGGSSGPSVAVVKLSAQGELPAGRSVAGLGATIELPAGVTVKTTATGAVDAGVVTPSGLFGAGNAAMGPVSYTPATATSRARLDFAVFSTAPGGVGVGEYVTINCSLHGVTPVAADFLVSSFTLTDLNYVELTMLTASKSVTVY